MLQTIIEHLNNLPQKSDYDLYSYLELAVLGGAVAALAIYTGIKILEKLNVFFWQFIFSLARGNFQTRISKWGRRNIEFLITHYEEEILRVGAVRSGDATEKSRLYDIFIFDILKFLMLFIVLLVIYLTNYMNNFIVICGLLGMSFNLLSIRSFYSLKLIKNAYFFDQYIHNTESKINKLKTLLGS